jgi:signal transduction histidine kinase
LKIEFELETLPPVLGDGVRLSQVFENLFSNAIKYAPGSKLKIVTKSLGKKFVFPLPMRERAFLKIFCHFFLNVFIVCLVNAPLQAQGWGCIFASKLLWHIMVIFG